MKFIIMKFIINKKTGITAVVAIIFLSVLYNIIGSPNFLIPIEIPKKEYVKFFKHEVLDKMQVVHSLRNINNYLVVVDIDSSTRCWIRKFQGSIIMPNYSRELIRDSIALNMYSEVSLGLRPNLCFRNKFDNSKEGNYLVEAGENSVIDTVISVNNYLSIIGDIDELGMFKDEDICETLFLFDKKTYANYIFYRNESNFYIITLYDLNNKRLNPQQNILRNMTEWY